MLIKQNELNIETIKFLRNEIKQFDAEVIIEGNNETWEEKIINSYANGTIQGYKDAVNQIIDFLDDLILIK